MPNLHEIRVGLNSSIVSKNVGQHTKKTISKRSYTYVFIVILSYSHRFDLVDPVADGMGIIYEKISILDYLTRHGRNGTVKCPMQGR